MLVRGARQKRQSEGKRVAKTLSAIPLTDETKVDISDLCRVNAGVPVARIGSSLLLKTSLPRSPGTDACTGKSDSSIAGRKLPGNDSAVRPPRLVAFWIPASAALKQTS